MIAEYCELNELWDAGWKPATFIHSLYRRRDKECSLFPVPCLSATCCLSPLSSSCSLAICRISLTPPFPVQPKQWMLTFNSNTTTVSLMRLWPRPPFTSNAHEHTVATQVYRRCSSGRSVGCRQIRGMAAMRTLWNAAPGLLQHRARWRATQNYKLPRWAHQLSGKWTYLISCTI